MASPTASTLPAGFEHALALDSPLQRVLTLVGEPEKTSNASTELARLVATCGISPAPSFRRLTPKGAQWTAAELRSALEPVTLLAHPGATVVVLEHCESLTGPRADSLLKELEDASGSLRWILCTTSVDLPTTLRSRVYQVFTLSAPNTDIARDLPTTDPVTTTFEELGKKDADPHAIVDAWRFAVAARVPGATTPEAYEQISRALTLLDDAETALRWRVRPAPVLAELAQHLATHIAPLPVTTARTQAHREHTTAPSPAPAPTNKVASLDEMFPHYVEDPSTPRWSPEPPFTPRTPRPKERAK